MRFASLVAAVALAASPALAEPDPVARVSVTRHSVKLDDGRTLGYVAEVGMLPIRPQGALEAHGYVGYVSYRVAPAAGKVRPVAFLWGGGPSGPSSGENLAYGPKRIVDGRVVDNPMTLLSVADLVFVDPVGTGFARPAKADYAKEFYQVLGDQASVAEAIRVWRATKDPAGSPIFLEGVSYGTWRVSGVTELLEKSGVRVAGAILNSGGIQMGPEAQPRAITVAYRTPGRTAAALHHKLLSADLGTDRNAAMAKAFAWSKDTYAPALARLDQLAPAEREAIARDLSRFTGYPLDKIDRKTLEVTPRAYLANLLAGQTLTVNDMRVATTAGGPAGRGVTYADHLRRDLGFRTDLAYLPQERGYTPNGETYAAPGGNWNYNSAKITPEIMAAAQAGEGPPGTDAWLKRAMEIDPKLHVLVAAGFYDSLNSCVANEDLIARQPKAIAERFTLRCYAAGHGIRSPDATPLWQADLRAFIAKRMAQP